MSQKDQIQSLNHSISILWSGPVTAEGVRWLQSIGVSRKLITDVASRSRKRTPILVDGSVRPLPYWGEFFAALFPTLTESSIKSYAYDARRFAAFLHNRNTDVVNATQADLVAYRMSRTDQTTGQGVSHATWSREKTLISMIYTFLVHRGFVKRKPWVQIGARSPIDHPGLPGSPRIRFLSHDQWRTFQTVGLKGQLPNGELDIRWRVPHPLRNSAGARLALDTGMRLNEFSSVLDLEVPLTLNDSVTFDIEATAKFSKKRTIVVPPETLRAIDLYRRTERRNLVLSTMSARMKQLKNLAIVTDLDFTHRKLTIQFHGDQATLDIPKIPSSMRRVLVIETKDGYEPMSLFIGSNGLALQRRAWSSAFAAASKRIHRFLDTPGMPRMPPRVTAHDLRHTFAIVVLRTMMLMASSREAARRQGELGHGSMSDHIVHNPVLAVQRLLGHSSPLTTMTYLRYVEDTEEVVRHALNSWEDTERNYLDYLGEIFSRRGDND